jgi:murein DD-endopeptidase MepM/ murein hydrolase activator NlpD
VSENRCVSENRWVSESRSLSVLRRSARVAVAAATAVVPAAGVAAVVAFQSPATTTTPVSSHRPAPMVYDRDEMQVFDRLVAEKHRQEMLAWYLSVDSQRRQMDQQRASRGEPREALPGGASTARYWRPTTGTLTQPFHPGHDGIDIGVPLGTPVLAAAAGTVAFAGVESGYGNHIEVRHADGTVTTYSHLSTIDVAVDQPVQAGQQIAHSGNTGHSTGPHLHFEVKLGGTAFTDPIAWLRSRGAW